MHFRVVQPQRWNATKSLGSLPFEDRPMGAAAPQGRPIGRYRLSSDQILLCHRFTEPTFHLLGIPGGTTKIQR